MALVINFFHFYWPHLLKKPGFLSAFVPPVVKVCPKLRSFIVFFRLSNTYTLLERSGHEKGRNPFVRDDG